MRIGAPTCFSDKLFAVSVLCILFYDYAVTLLMILQYPKIVITPDEITIWSITGVLASRKNPNGSE